MNFADRTDPSEDMFADTRMTFGEHLEDLRVHLWRAVYGFLVALVVGFAVGWPVLEFISLPVEVQLQSFYERRAQNVRDQLAAGNPDMAAMDREQATRMKVQVGPLAKALGVKLPEGTSAEEFVELPVLIHPLDLALLTSAPNRIVYRRPGLSTLSPQEAFMAYIKVSFVCGLVIGSPWIFYQIWMFVAAGLYPHEKRLVNVYLPISLILFIAGVAVCQFLVIPKALEALLLFNRWLDLEPDFRFNEWLGFAILLPVLFGVSFQLPMVMLFLERIGIFTVQTYLQKWRLAVFLMHAFAAFVAPIDAISMESMALALCALYFLGIGLCRFGAGARQADEDVPDSEELVEV